MSGGDAAAAGSPFWRFSLKFYRQPQVAEACIALQDGAGIDVNLLLFLLWQAAEGRTLAVAEVDALEAADRALAQHDGHSAARRAARIESAAGAGRERRPRKPTAPGSRRWNSKPSACSRKRCTNSRAHRRSAVPRLLRKTPRKRNIAAYEAICARAFPKPAVETLLAAFAQLEHKPEE